MRQWIAAVALVLTIILVGCAQVPAPPSPTTVPAMATALSTATATSAPTMMATAKPAAAPATPVQPDPTPTPVPTEAPVPFAITSPAFDHEAAIPQRYTCDGDDISPALAWTAPPAGTQSFALICDDPDAPGGTWVHWVVYNLPADVRGLPEAVAGDAALPGGVHGANSWQRTGYGGPCPPNGTHRYFFKLYALDTTLALAPGASKAQVLEAMEGHLLAEVELMGTYARK